MGSGACLIQCQKAIAQIKPSVDFHFDAVPALRAWIDDGLLPVATPLVTIDQRSVLRPAGASLQILFCSFQS